MNAPHWLPPETARPVTSIIRAGNARQIRRALVPLAALIVTQRISFYRGVEFLAEAWARHCWSGKSETLQRFVSEAVIALDKACREAERVGEDIEREETYREWAAQP